MVVKLLFLGIACGALMLFFGLLLLAHRLATPDVPVALTVPQNDLALPAQPLETFPVARVPTPVAAKSPGPQISVTPPLAACDPRASVSITAPRAVPAR